MKAPIPHPLPEIPAGMDYARDSFWYKYRHRFAWWSAVRALGWYVEQREKAKRYGQPFPPKPFFQKKTTMPTPWDGREEKPGRVPRQGK